MLIFDEANAIGTAYQRVSRHVYKPDRWTASPYKFGRIRISKKNYDEEK